MTRKTRRVREGGGCTSYKETHSLIIHAGYHGGPSISLKLMEKAMCSSYPHCNCTLKQVHTSCQKQKLLDSPLYKNLIWKDCSLLERKIHTGVERSVKRRKWQRGNDHIPNPPCCSCCGKGISDLETK